MQTKDIKQKEMTRMFSDTQCPPSVGDILEGRVQAIDKAAVYVDLAPFGTGIIYGREYINARDLIKNITIGDSVTGSVVDEENENGYIELSLKEAKQAIIWNDAEMAMAEKKTFNLPVLDANKGGLILEWNGIQGFIPASQLKPENYPRVDDADKDKILTKLQELVGQNLAVTIIGVNHKENKLIFSEKGLGDKEKERIVGTYSVGDEIEGEITGIVDFGVFIKVEDNLEGLAHISELDWGLVENPRDLFKVGEKVRAKVIDVKDGQISLSIKATKKNPWEIAKDKYKKGQKVDAVVIKHNKYGALASIEEGVAGLVHVSEFESEDALKSALELGKTYRFVINLFEPDNQRMTLSLVK